MNQSYGGTRPHQQKIENIDQEIDTGCITPSFPIMQYLFYKMAINDSDLVMGNILWTCRQFLTNWETKIRINFYERLTVDNL